MFQRCAFLVLTVLAAVVAAEDPYVSYPYLKEAAEARQARLSWWSNARLGLQVRPSLGGPGGEYLMRGKRIPVAEYARRAASFDPAGLDADTWANHARQLGAGYLVLQAKHFDGFAFFASAASEFNSVAATPLRRDLVKDFSEACARNQLRFGVSYAPLTDWHHPGGLIGKDGSWDAAQKGDIDTHVDSITVPQLKELVGKYPISGVWFETESTGDNVPERNNRIFAALANDRGLLIGPGLGRSDMSSMGIRCSAQAIPPRLSFEVRIPLMGVTDGKTQDKTKEDIMRRMVAVWLRGGNVLLTANPDAEGRSTADQQLRIRDLGAWFKQLSPSIRNTIPGPLDYLPFGRSTHRDKTLFLHITDWPSTKAIRIPSASEPASVHLLGSPGKQLPHRLLSTGLIIELPEKAPDAIDSVVVLEFSELPLPSLQSWTTGMPVTGDEFVASTSSAVDDSPISSASLKEGKGTLTIDLMTPKKIGVFRLGHGKNQIGKLTVEAEQADGGWTTIVSETKPSMAEYVKTFPDITVQRVRVTVADSPGEVQLSSIELFPSF